MVKYTKIHQSKFAKLAALAVLFSASFLILFYVPLLFFVKNYIIDYYYVGINLLFFCVLTFLSLTMPGPRLLYTVLLCVALGFPVLITSSYAAIYRQMPDHQIFFFIWETNSTETVEFIQDALAKSSTLVHVSILTITLPLVSLFFLLRESKVLKVVKLRSRTAMAALSIVALLVMQNLGMLDFNYAYRYYYNYLKYEIDLNVAIELSNTAAERIKDVEVLSTRPQDICETYVIVIGESASRHHMSMYGYNRVTDPRMVSLKQAGEVCDFNNVISNVLATTNSLLQTFSFMGYDGYDRRLSRFKFSLVDVFNAAGFETTWLSNNAVMLGHDTILQSLSRNAHKRLFTENKQADLSSLINKKETAYLRQRSYKSDDHLTYDASLIPWFETALASKAQKKVIFIHLKGSHVIYWYRFPNQFEKFIKSNDILPKTFEINDDLINDYDNSIYYTDYLLGEFITRLRAKGGESWLLYFSDHGEEVYDFRTFQGRNIENPSKFVVDVPLFLWLSEGYRKIRDASNWHDYRNRPYELSSLIHTILDLANIETTLQDENKSIISSSYTIPARLALGVPYLLLEPQNLYNPETFDEEVAAVEQSMNFIQK